MDTKKPLIIVLSRNYSTGLGVIRSLGEAGYTVDLVASVKKKGSSVIASSSKYIRRTTEVLSPRIQDDSGEGLIEVLIEYAHESEEEIVLFPTDDFTASILDANRGRLKEHFVMPEIRKTVGQAETRTMNQLMDKTVQSEIAREAGLKTPLEWIIYIGGDIRIPENMVYPCFVKPLQSNSGHKTEMAVCSSKEELVSHIQSMKAFFSERSILVQEFLNIDKEFDVAGVCLDQEIILPAVIEKTGIAGFERGVAMSGKVLPPETLGDTIEKIKNMLREYHYVGMFDIDLNMCGDEMYFSEVNLRSGGLNFAYYLGGVNLPAIYVDSVTGDGQKFKKDADSLGHTFVYEKVAWEDYIHGFISKKELKKRISEADYTLLDTKMDPRPGEIFNKRIRLSFWKNRLKKFLSKDEKNITHKSQGDVIVTGRNYCNILTMSRALGEAGYSVDVLRVFKTKPNRLNLLRLMKPEAYSKYVDSYSECIADNNPYKIAQRLKKMAAPGKKQLLVPVDDYLVGAVDQYLDELKDVFLIPSVKEKAGKINMLMDKNRQKELAEKAELPLLQSVLIKSEKGKFTIPESIKYPCFIKPNVSMNSTKGHMKKCEDREELEKVLTGFAQKGDFEILAEEFADIKTEYSILGVCDGSNAISPCMFKVIEGGHRERKGVTLIGETVSCEKYKTIIEKCNMFVCQLGYRGIFDIDLIETKDGSIYFIEINFRAGASMDAFTETGVNLAKILADNFLKDKEIDLSCTVNKTGRRFISEKILMEEFARGDASFKKVRKAMKEVDVHFVKNDKDLKPYKYFNKFYLVAMMMRFMYRFK